MQRVLAQRRGGLPVHLVFAMTTIQLSTLVPAWRGHLIPAAHAALAEGIRLERIRFMSDRFIIVSLVSELDFDGCFDQLYLDAGLRKADDVRFYCKHVLQHRMAEAMVRVGPHTESWKQIDEEDLPERFRAPRVQVMSWERRGDGTGWNAITILVGVLEVNVGDPLSVQDLVGIGNECELQRYLCSVGAQGLRLSMG